MNALARCVAVTLFVTVCLVSGPVYSAAGYFTVPLGGTLTVPAPGVLGDDSQLPGSESMTVELVAGSANGSVLLSGNGGFVYSPTNSVGMHGFIYEASDAAGNSNTAAALVSVLPPNGLFADNFARPAGVVQSAPWKNPNGGNWTVTNGLMRATSQLNSPTHVYLSNNWTDYAIEVRASMPTNGYAWNVGGRLNPATASYYGVALLPYGEGNFYDPTNSWVLRLVKYKGWDEWSGTTMNYQPDVRVGGPDTNSHTLKLTFHGNRIMVDWDGIRKIDQFDNDWEGPKYASGGVTMGIYTGSTSYALNFEKVLVQALPLAIKSLAVANNIATLAWNSVSNETYRLQYKTHLSWPNWTSVVPDVRASGSWTVVTNATGGDNQRFYRVVVP